MDFQTSIQTCFKKYAVFSGRASRPEFWWFFLFALIGGIVVQIIDVMILGYSIEGGYGPAYAIFSVITFLPCLAVGARRLHDINKSGWWQLLFITIVGIVLLIIWWATAGERKKNIYGR